MRIGLHGGWVLVRQPLMNLVLIMIMIMIMAVAMKLALTALALLRLMYGYKVHPLVHMPRMIFTPVQIHVSSPFTYSADLKHSEHEAKKAAVHYPRVRWSA